MKRYLVIPDEYKIEEIEVFKENALSYWVFLSPVFKGLEFVKPRRFNRNGLLFDTWEAAHEKLLCLSKEKVDNIRQILERVKSYYGNVKGMKKPEVKTPYLGSVDYIVEGIENANQ